MTSHRVRNWRTGGPDGVIAGDSTVSPLIVDNVKEELDAGGEYYFDAAVHELSLIPNGTDAAPPTRVVAAHLVGDKHRKLQMCPPNTPHDTLIAPRYTRMALSSCTEIGLFGLASTRERMPTPLVLDKGKFFCFWATLRN